MLQNGLKKCLEDSSAETRSSARRRVSVVVHALVSCPSVLCNAVILIYLGHFFKSAFTIFEAHWPSRAALIAQASSCHDLKRSASSVGLETHHPLVNGVCRPSTREQHACSPMHVARRREGRPNCNLPPQQTLRPNCRCVLWAPAMRDHFYSWHCRAEQAPGKKTRPTAVDPRSTSSSCNTAVEPPADASPDAATAIQVTAIQVHCCRAIFLDHYPTLLAHL